MNSFCTGSSNTLLIKRPSLVNKFYALIFWCPICFALYPQLNPYNYKGSWADNFKPRSCENMSTSEEDFPHYESQCLRCMSLAKCASKNSVKSSQRKSVEKREDKKILKSSISRTDSAFTKKKVSSSSLPPTEPDCEDRLMVNKEILRLVVNLSSSVASKASQQGLIV